MFCINDFPEQLGDGVKEALKLHLEFLLYRIEMT